MKRIILESIDEKYYAYMSNDGYGFEAMEGVDFRGGGKMKKRVIFCIGIAAIIAGTLLPR